MKKILDNKYANLYLNAADKLGLQYKILNADIGHVLIYQGDNKLVLSENVLDVNTELSSRLAANKKKTSILLQNRKIPVPDFKSFKSEKKAIQYGVKKIKDDQKIVVKPVRGSLALGITVCPSSESEIISAVREAFSGKDEILIESFIPGNHYRISVLDSQVIAITQRISAYVIADGKSSLQELIEQKNQSREKTNLPPITLREKDLNLLKSKKLDLQNIYPNGKKITLQLGCDLDIGGERKRININAVPMVNRELFAQAVHTLNLRFGGVDYISPDITIPYTGVVSAINEVNSSPHTDVHYKDSIPNSNYAAERIIKTIFDINSDQVIKIPTRTIHTLVNEQTIQSAIPETKRKTVH